LNDFDTVSDYFVVALSQLGQYHFYRKKIYTSGKEQQHGRTYKATACQLPNESFNSIYPHDP
jgi:hypothetical protein